MSGVIRVRSTAFANSVAARYAPALRHSRRIARVLVRFSRRSAVHARGRPQHAGLTLRLTHRLSAEERTRAIVTHSRTLVQRVERHVAATRHLVERTQRVEQAAMRPATLAQLTTNAETHGAGSEPARIVVAALPRVLRRPAASAEQLTATRAPAPETVRQRPVAPTPPIDVARLTDEVMRGIDKRLAAWRERRGRV